VQELLRDDRRIEVGVGESRPLALFAGFTPLELGPHVGDVEPDDLVAVDPADLAAVVRDQLHPQTFCAARV
jgi:hypothetical protein